MGRHSNTVNLDTEEMRTVRVETRTVWADTWYLLMRVKKFIVALIGAASTASVMAASMTGPPTLQNWREWVPTGIAFLTALGVFGVKNREKE